MKSLVTAIVLLVSCYCFAPVSAYWDHNITVRGLSLNEALRGLVYNSTAVYFSEGLHQLQPGDEATFQYMTDIAFLPTTPDTVPVIQCLNNAGLSFVWSSRIILRNITLKDCSMEQWTTSRDFTIDDSFEFIKVQVAVYFSFCSDITLDSVTIQPSSNDSRRGYGVIIYNTRGNNKIYNSHFISNGGYPLPMGGGIVIEFSYCIPGQSSDCPTTGPSHIDSHLVTNSVYDITRNLFNDNIASPSYFTNLDPYPSKGRDYFGLGRGGGLSCVFKGNSRNNTIIMNSNTFDSNTAQFGGSFYVAFDDAATNNRVFSTSDTIIQSAALVPDSSLTFVPPVAEGGGALFLYGTEDNYISLKSAQLNRNFGTHFGGGIAVKSLISTPASSNPGILVIDNTTMEYNNAKQGAGIYFINMYPDSKPVIVNISNCAWSSNNVEESCTPPTHVRCTGIVYTKMLPLSFSGNVNKFMNNKGSALDIHETTVSFYSQALVFTGNSADNGPAIHVSNCGKVIVSNDIDIFFQSNTAFFSGGAIYETGCTLTSLSYAGVGTSQCFIQFIDNKIHPDNWNSSFFFSNNIAGKVINSIYTDSLFPCAWLISDTPLLTQEDINQTFCWEGWHYDTFSCQEVIQSGPAYINITTPIDPYYYQLYTSPGQPFYLSLKAYNNYNKEQFEEVKICVVSRFGSLHPYRTAAPDCITAWTADAVPITLFALPTYSLKCNQFEVQSVTVSIETVNPPYPKISIPFSFDQCPKYTHFDCPECYLSLSTEIGLKCVDTMSCQLPQTPCTLNSSLTTTSSYCWNIDTSRHLSSASSHQNISSSLPLFIGGNCPYSYGRSLPCAPITDFTSGSSPNLCPGNRKGRLCGRCAENFELTTNTIDLRCVKCSGLMWPTQLAIQMVVITLLIIIIVVFSISLNAGGTNAFIFFAQVVTIKYPGLSYPSWIFEPNPSSLAYNHTLIRGFTLLYSISNFDVITPLPLDPFCLSPDFTPIHSILIDFIPAFYPLLLLGLIYIWIALYSYECKPFFGITRSMLNLCRFSESSYKLSLLDSFATIAIICFSLITATCFKLLTPTFFYTLNGEWTGTAFYYDGALDYFGSGHLIYAIASCVILVVFVLIPATLLTCSTCITQKLQENRYETKRITALTNTFNSCFKDNTKGGTDLRFFAGLYLFLRIGVRLFFMLHDARLILALEVALSIVVATILIGVRPYKNDLYNIFDAAIFLYLGLMAGVSAAGYAFVFYKGFLYLPLLVVLGYGLYKAAVKIKKCGICCRKKKIEYTLVPVLSDDDEEPTPADDEVLLPDPFPRSAQPLANDPHNTEAMFADRLLNPEQYTKPPST